MKKEKERFVHREIIKIKQPYPNNDLIFSYKDFLKYRSSLPFYQFNPQLFQNLITLILEKWKSDERISRLSLLETLKRYCLKDSRVEDYLNFNNIICSLSLDLRIKLFQLYKLVWEFPEFVTKVQQDEVQKIANLLMINVSLNKNGEVWLCQNYKKSPLILNRILRYPKKSPVISAWAREIYDEDSLRSRRAEIIGFILDEDSNFEVSKNTIMDDFEYQNLKDSNAIEEFKEELSIFNLFQDSDDIFPGDKIDKTVPYPELKLTKRFYQVPTIFSENLYKELPDFVRLRKDFLSNLDLSYQVTMMWAIKYSRLSNDLKAQLLINHYSIKSEPTFIKICQRSQLSTPLEWLISKGQDA